MTGNTKCNPTAKQNYLLKTPTEVKFKQSRVQVEDLVCGEGFTLALTTKCEVYGWGMNDFGQLGKEDTSINLFEPTKISIPNQIVRISCGLKHCVVISEDNQIYVWGQNSYGQLGLKTQDNYSFIPTKLESFTRAGVVDLKAGYNHTIALSS